MTAAVIRLLRKYRLKLARVHASAKLDHSGVRGQNSGLNGKGLTRVIVSDDRLQGCAHQVEERHDAHQGAEDEQGVEHDPARRETRTGHAARRPRPQSP